MRHISRSGWPCALAAVVLLSSAPALWSQTNSKWTGNVNTLWNQSHNWTHNQVPNNSGPNPPYAVTVNVLNAVVDVNISPTIQSLTLRQGTVNILASNTLTLASGSVSLSPLEIGTAGILNVGDSGTLKLAITDAIAGPFAQFSASNKGILNLNFSGGAGGVLQLDDGGNFNALLLNGNGALNVNSATLQGVSGAETLRLEGGVMTSTGPSQVTNLNLTVDFPGKLSVTSGVLQFNGSATFQNEGIVRVGGGAVLDAGTGFSNIGLFGDPNTLYDGDYRVRGILQYNGNDIQTLDGTSVSLRGTGDVVNMATGNSLQQTLTTLDGAQLELRSGATFTLPTGQTFTNNGAVAIRGSASLLDLSAGTYSNVAEDWTTPGQAALVGGFHYLGGDLHYASTQDITSLDMGSNQEFDLAGGKLFNVTTGHDLTQTLNTVALGSIFGVTNGASVAITSGSFLNNSLVGVDAFSTLDLSPSTFANVVSNTLSAPDLVSAYFIQGTLVYGGDDIRTIGPEVSVTLHGAGDFRNITTGSLGNSLTLNRGFLTLENGAQMAMPQDFHNEGVVALFSAGTQLTVAGGFTNDGSVVLGQHGLPDADQSALLTASFFTNNGDLEIYSGPTDAQSGQVVVDNGFLNTGSVLIDNNGAGNASLTVLAGDYAQIGSTAETTVNGDLFAPVDLLGGLLDGTGTVYGTVYQTDGAVSPGSNSGTAAFTIEGDYIQVGGELLMEIWNVPGNPLFDQLSVSGNVFLNGIFLLDPSVYIAFGNPQLGDQFDLLHYGGFLTFGSSFEYMGQLLGNDLWLVPHTDLVANELIFVVETVPEPGSFSLFAAAAFLAAIYLLRRRKLTTYTVSEVR